MELETFSSVLCVSEILILVTIFDKQGLICEPLTSFC